MALRRRIVASVIAALLLLAFAVIVSFRVERASRIGSAGLRLNLDEYSVKDVSPGGAPAAAGLSKEHRIVKIGGIPVRDEQRLQVQAEQLKRGEGVHYLVRTGSATHVVDVRLRSPYGASAAVI